MDSFIPQNVPFHVLELGVGAVLLLFGRKVFWLALAAAGAVLGLWIAERYVFAEPSVRLAIALVLAVGGVVVAIVAQKVAVAIGGFLVGGMAALQAGVFLDADLNTGLWLGIILGTATLGAFLGSLLFETMLAVVTAWIGAAALVRGLELASPTDMLAFGGLLVFGIFFQSRLGKRRVTTADRQGR